MVAERPSKHKEALSRVVDGEAMVLVQQPEVTTIVLNAVATRVWEMIDGQHNVTDIAEVIAKEYEVSMADAEKDVREVLRDMNDKGMLAGEGSTE